MLYQEMRGTFQVFFETNTQDPRMVPPKRKGDLELRRKKIFSFFLFYGKRRWVPRVVRYKFFAW